MSRISNFGKIALSLAGLLPCASALAAQPLLYNPGRIAVSGGCTRNMVTNSTLLRKANIWKHGWDDTDQYNVDTEYDPKAPVVCDIYVNKNYKDGSSDQLQGIQWTFPPTDDVDKRNSEMQRTVTRLNDLTVSAKDQGRYVLLKMDMFGWKDKNKILSIGPAKTEVQLVKDASAVAASVNLSPQQSSSAEASGAVTKIVINNETGTVRVIKSKAKAIARASASEIQ